MFKTLCFSLMILAASAIAQEVPDIEISDELKASVEKSLLKHLKSDRYEVLTKLHQANTNSAEQQGFKSDGKTYLRLSPFSADKHRIDFTFSQEQSFKRSCPQIPRCAYEEIVVQVRGVTMVHSDSMKVGYVVPTGVSSSFSQIFNKGGASVGGAR